MTDRAVEGLAEAVAEVIYDRALLGACALISGLDVLRVLLSVVRGGGHR